VTNTTFIANKARLTEIFAETGKGNWQPFLDALAEDASWTIIGSTKWSKSYQGKAAILRDLMGSLRRVLKLPAKAHATRLIAEGDFVVVEGRGDSVTQDGKPYKNSYCWVFQFKDGQVSSISEYADTDLFNTALGDPR
jgi:uncharacterized protein